MSYLILANDSFVMSMLQKREKEKKRRRTEEEKRTKAIFAFEVIFFFSVCRNGVEGGWG